MAFGNLQVGANGVQAHDKAMGVIGDNIANTNTLAYKGSTAHFGDMLAQSIGTSTATGLNQIGTGSQINSVSPNFSQGSFRGTSQNTDMAIDGDGFFKMRQPEANAEEGSLATYYTRAGNFSKDKDGFLVGSEGARVQGWQAVKDENGNYVINDDANPQGEDINIDELATTTQETKNVSQQVNLNASEENAVGAATVNQTADPGSSDNPFDPADDQTFTYKTESTVYDSQGGEHLVSQYYRKVGVNKWEVHTVANANEVTDGTGNAAYSNTPANTDGNLYATEADPTAGSDLVRLSMGTLEFDGNGALLKENQTLEDVPNGSGGTVDVNPKDIDGNGNNVGVANFDTETNGDNAGNGVVSGIFWANGSSGTTPTPPESPQTITFDHGTAIDTAGGNGLGGATQRAGQSVLYSQNVDGRGLGDLQSWNVNEEGVIVGTFDNGATQPLAKVGLASVDNPEAMTRAGDNRYTLSDAAGGAIFSEPGTDGVGSIRGFTLEESNVKASEEFTRMIAIQRGYQANTKTIQTVDEMLQQLMRIK